MTHPDFAYIGDPATNLIEECAELIQALTKLQRFGPGVPPYDNRAQVIAEIADVRNRITEWDIHNAALAAQPIPAAAPVAGEGEGILQQAYESTLGKPVTLPESVAQVAQAAAVAPAQAAVGAWTLTAPDGRQWHADSALKCAAAEQRERIPAKLALDRIFADVDAFEAEERAKIAGELERHAVSASACPPDSQVVTLYAIKRLLGALPQPPIAAPAGDDRSRASGDVVADTRRLDYLQRTGSTVDIVQFARGGAAWKFRIGGLHHAVHEDIRGAIDMAITLGGTTSSEGASDVDAPT